MSNKYSEAWNTDVVIVTKKKVPEPEPEPEQPIQLTAVDYLLENSTNINNATYNSSTKCNLFVFNHESTAQTPAQTDYRYIGQEPYNYVYFNCSNLNNQSSSTCEIWRIIGIFEVQNGVGVSENRIKLIRESSFTHQMKWSTNDNYWRESSLNEFLNVDYFKRQNDATSYGLRESSRNMVGYTKYYIGV